MDEKTSTPAAAIAVGKIWFDLIQETANVIDYMSFMHSDLNAKYHEWQKAPTLFIYANNEYKARLEENPADYPSIEFEKKWKKINLEFQGEEEYDESASEFSIREVRVRFAAIQKYLRDIGILKPKEGESSWIETAIETLEEDLKR